MKKHIQRRIHILEMIIVTSLLLFLLSGFASWKVIHIQDHWISKDMEISNYHITSFGLLEMRGKIIVNDHPVNVTLYAPNSMNRSKTQKVFINPKNHRQIISGIELPIMITITLCLLTNTVLMSWWLYLLNKSKHSYKSLDIKKIRGSVIEIYSNAQTEEYDLTPADLL